MTSWSYETVEKAARAIQFCPNIWAADSRNTAKIALAVVAECKEVSELRTLLEECEGVLTYYRRIDNYMANLADDGRFNFRNTDIHKDGGSRAREMLTKLHAAGIGGK